MAEEKTIQLEAKFHGGPFTEKALGEELYRRLAVETGAFDPKSHPGYRPALDLTGFKLVAPPTATKPAAPAKSTPEVN